VKFTVGNRFLCKLVIHNMLLHHVLNTFCTESVQSYDCSAWDVLSIFLFGLCFVNKKSEYVLLSPGVD
jgi:hypothetical protein